MQPELYTSDERPKRVYARTHGAKATNAISESNK